MAVTRRRHGRFWQHLHFFVRFLGLTGLLAAACGAVLVAVYNLVPTMPTQDDALLWRDYFLGQKGDVLEQTTARVIGAGLALVLLALLVELIVGALFVAGRRSVTGFNAVLQIVLAVVLLAGVNVFAFLHHARFDCTLKQEFTLPADVTRQLKQLDAETDIVVYQRHKTFGALTDKPDAYDYAAERKVTEKVKDLVEQFQTLGPQFRVQVLDVEEEGFNDRLARLKEDAPTLRQAIDAAGENSIFFYTRAGKNRGSVQRLSFNDFFMLDKTASLEADGGRGNLVLRNQGVQPFARKVLNIDEKRPVIGLLTVHEWLTAEGQDEYGLSGLRKALSARGFEVRDVVLKKWSRFAPPEAAVYTYEESKLDRLEERLTILNNNVKAIEQAIAGLKQEMDLWKTAKLDDLTKRYEDQLRGRKITEPMRQMQLLGMQEEQLDLNDALDYNRSRRDSAAQEKDVLDVEGLAEQRRIVDLKAKLDRVLLDCDLVILPRMTLRNIHLDDMIPQRVYALEQPQADAIKEYLKAGKPLLACFGPSNEPADRQQPPDAAGPDPVETLLADLGIRFGKQTVLFDVESEAFAERRSGLLTAGVEAPPLEFDWNTGAGRPLTLATQLGPDLPPNPIRESMYLTARSLGPDRPLELRLLHPRPVYFQPPEGRRPAFDPDFLMTSAASWNEAQPFPTPERTPQYERPKPTDPSRGTLDEPRRGPFPVGVAVQVSLPKTWYPAADAEPATARVAAVGQGGFFTGRELSPAKEQLMLDTCNWLLGRDDLLPGAGTEWRYPRLNMSVTDQRLWLWGTCLGMPLLFAYFGMLVLLARRLR